MAAAPAPESRGSALRGGAVADTLVEHFRRQVRTRPEANAMYFRAGGRWAPITWGQFGAAARRLAAVLLEDGIEAGDHVAIWSANRPEWHIADVATLSLRARPVPVYLTVSAEQAVYVMAHSEAKVAVVENSELLTRLLAARAPLVQLRRIVVLDGITEVAEGGLVLPWRAALERGETVARRRAAELDERAAAVVRDDVATLIYTSGTTGPPKAVKLTHGNVLAAVNGFASLGGAGADDRLLSYLPLAHIAERNHSEYRQYVFGNPVYFVPSVDRLPEHLVDVRPTSFFAVPRIWEKFAARLQAEIASAPGARRRLARWAMNVGRRRCDLTQRQARPGPLLAGEHRLADWLVLRRLRSRLGFDQARVLASGAAPIAAEILRFFAALGLEVLEVYGQTEDCGATTVNRPGRARFGTVGLPVPGVEVRLADDGEILVRGEVVFPGYHKDDAATSEVLVDGWLHTGDVGQLDPDGSLRITDRKKDLIITAGGENISPSNIETALKNHPLVSNAVAIGDRRPFVSALITLERTEVDAFNRARGLAGEPAERALRDEMRAHVDAVNAQLSSVERVKRWTLLDADFTVGDELTPTLKVKRTIVVEKYAGVIEAHYSATN